MTVESKLEEAQSAYHDLVTGAAVVSITKNNRQVSYSQTNKSDLREYIEELKIQLGQKSTRRRGPLGVRL